MGMTHMVVPAAHRTRYLPKGQVVTQIQLCYACQVYTGSLLHKGDMKVDSDPEWMWLPQPQLIFPTHIILVPMGIDVLKRYFPESQLIRLLTRAQIHCSLKRCSRGFRDCEGDSAEGCFEGRWRERALPNDSASATSILPLVPKHTGPGFQNSESRRLCGALQESSHLSFKHLSHPRVGWLESPFYSRGNRLREVK